MLTLAVFCALAVGWLTGGRLSRFERAGLRWLPLPVVALLVQELLLPRLPALAPPLVALSYGMLLVFFWNNRHLKKFALLAGSGCALNALVISANGFRMPVTQRAAEHLSSAGLARLTTGEIPMYALAGPDTRMWFLGDILYCPLPVLGGFASIGDLLLAAGVFFCILCIMAPSKLPGWMLEG